MPEPEMHHGSHSSARVPKAIQAIKDYHVPQPQRDEADSAEGQPDEPPSLDDSKEAQE